MINYPIFKRVKASVVLVFCLALISAGCGSGGGDDGVVVGDGGGGDVLTDGRSVVSVGTVMSLGGVTVGGDIVEIDSSELPTVVLGGFLPEHTIFSITKHPTENWLYVTSMNECNLGNNACWGNARIDRFSYTRLGIAHEDIVFQYLFGSGPACADEDLGFDGQTGACAPTSTAFSADGLRLYVNDDRDDNVQIFRVHAITGALTYLSEGATTFLQGLAVSPDGNYLYNGSHVIQVIADVATDLLPGAKGNATEVVTNALAENLLATTQSNMTLAIYNLIDQAAPALIHSIGIPNQQGCDLCGAARFQDSPDDLGMFIVVGANSVATVSFDGTTLTLLDQVFDTNPLDVMNRGVEISEDGTYAGVTWFIPFDEDGNRLMTGGVTVYGIAPDGTLTELGSVVLSVPSRAILAVPVP